MTRDTGSADTDARPEAERDVATDGGTATAAPTTVGGLVDKLVELKQEEWFVLGAAGLGILLLPFFTIEFLELVGELIGIDIGGYVGFPVLILIFGIVVVGFNILLGYTGLLSFGHAAFFGTATYAAALFSAHADAVLPEVVAQSPILMVLVGSVLGTLLAWPIGFLSIRRSGVYFAVLTLTFGQILYYFAMGPGSWITNGDNGFTPEPGALLGVVDLGDELLVANLPVFGSSAILPTFLYAFAAVFLVIALAAAYRILQSPYGLIFKALGENEQRVSFVGLDVFRYKLMAFIISGAYAGVGGALYAIYKAPTIHPNGTLYWIISGDFVIMAAVGGVGSLFGPLVGVFAFEYVRLVLSGIEIAGVAIGSRWRLLLGGLFVVVVAFFPEGIYGGFQALGRRVVDRFGNGTPKTAPAPREGADGEPASGSDPAKGSGGGK